MARISGGSRDLRQIPRTWSEVQGSHRLFPDQGRSPEICGNRPNLPATSRDLWQCDSFGRRFRDLRSFFPICGGLWPPGQCDPSPDSGQARLFTRGGVAGGGAVSRADRFRRSPGWPGFELSRRFYQTGRFQAVRASRAPRSIVVGGRGASYQTKMTPFSSASPS
jgi:hypothetical protein